MAHANPPTPLGHETRDIEARPIVYVSVLGLGVALLFAVAMWFLIDFSAEYQAEVSPPANPLAATFARKEPPAPRLQAHPLADLKTLRDGEAAVLGSYAWVDRGAGVVRIPIARAKELLVARGGAR